MLIFDKGAGQRLAQESPGLPRRPRRADQSVWGRGGAGGVYAEGGGGGWQAAFRQRSAWKQPLMGRTRPDPQELSWRVEDE